MSSQIKEQFARSVASVQEIRQALMRHLQKGISDLRRPRREDLRKGFSWDFAQAMAILALFTYLMWWFDYVEGFYDRVVLNLIAVALPLLAFFEAVREKGRRFSWQTAWLTLWIAVVVGLAVSNKFGIPAVGINLVVLAISMPWLGTFWILVRRRGILAVGIVPAAIMSMVYLAAQIFSNDPEYLLLPLMVVAPVTALWTGLVWLSFEGVDRWHEPGRPTLGPLMESLAMLLLLMPLMVLAILVPRAFPGGDSWSVVTAALVGVIFGGVVSDPLARFLRSYGRLPSHRRLDEGNEADPSQAAEGRSKQENR